jgi:hypothetical protein
MKKADAKIADWIESLGAFPVSAEKLSAGQVSFRALRIQIHQAMALREAESLHALVSLPQESQTGDAWLSAVTRLRSLGLVESASAIAKLGLVPLAALALERVLPALPSVALVEDFRKAAKVDEKVVRDYFLANTSGAASDVGREWLLARVAPDDLWPLFRQLVTEVKNGSPMRSDSARLLQTYLAKDPKGTRLVSFLAFLGNEIDAIAAFAATIRASDATFSTVIESLNHAARDKRTAAATGELLRQLFVEIVDLSGMRRKVACARLARAGSGFLLAPVDSPSATAGLESLAEIVDQLRNLTRDPDDRAVTWLLAPLQEKSADKVSYITADGARRWALAWEEADQTGQPLAQLETLGYNLGLRTIAEIGKQITYSPSVHEDIEGGLLPGNEVVVVACGWTFQGKPIVRARVRRPA